ncbi:NPCBM/NEW2 domain-containing protein [Verrucomicrobiales bacterium]|nr:NPCBM/NEW2 domain-containing protein [Verrucomicrobiales bacterium]
MKTAPKLLLAVLFSALTFSATLAAEKTKILFLAGPRSHASGDHEFNAGCRLLAKALNEQSGLDVEASVINGWPKDDSAFEGVDAVIIYSDSTKVVGQGWEKTDELAKAGVGLMFMHYAVHPSKEQGEKYFQPWIGGAFETGWSVNPHWVADLKTLPDHPISNGVTDLIRAYDEFYYSMRFPEDRSQVLDLVTATPSKERLKRIINLWNENGIKGIGKPQTLMWGIEREDGGRGVGFTGGHYHRNWAIDGFRQIALNAIVWVAGMDVPADGVPSKPLIEDELNENLDDYGKPNPRIPLPKVVEFMAMEPAPFVTMEDLKKREEEKKAKDAKKKNQKKKAPQKAAKPGTKTAAAYESPVMKSGAKDRIVALDVDLKKSKELYLVVSNEGSTSHDWADWLDTVVEFEDGTKMPLTELEWGSANSTGETRKNKNYDNKKLIVGGKEFANGIGTHAPSVIHYKLTKAAVRLTGKVALDDGGAIRGGKSTPAEVRFMVYTTAPPSDAASPAAATADFDPSSLEPQKVSLEHFVLPDDLEISVWATTPMLFNPTNMDTDSEGRIWVTEGVNYRRHAGRRPEGDRVVILEDTNGDGKADSTHTFVQDSELEAPLGIAVMDNQIIVSQPPSLIVYTDVNRDLKFDPAVDTRRDLLTGFNGRQHDHSLHAVTAGPNGKWYINQGNTGAQFTSADGKTFSIGGPYQGGGGKFYHNNYDLGGMVSDNGRVWTGGFAARMNRDATDLTIIGHGFRNSYEHTVTSLGDVFQNDNDDPPACRVSWMMEGAFFGFFSRDGKRTWQADQRPGQTIPEAHWRQDSPGTTPPGDVYGSGSPTGITFYENGALPEKYNGMLLSCEARGQVIFGYHPKPEGSTFALERFDFLKANPGTLFRPSDVLVGADGALYVSDWFDPGVGGHADRDESVSGTIYRIAPKEFKPAISKKRDPITLLSSPSPNVRDAGFVALKAKGKDLIPDVMSLLENSNKFVQARAAWLLPFAGESGISIATAMLSDEDAANRLLAYRVLRNAEHKFDDATLTKLAADKSAAVRREIAVSLRYAPIEKKVLFVPIVLDKMPQDDRTYLEACGLAAEGAEAEIWDILNKKYSYKSTSSWSDHFAWITWRLQPEAAIPALVKRARDISLTPEHRDLALDTIAFTRSKTAADAMAEMATGGDIAAKRWLLARAWGEWSEFGMKEKLKELGIYNPDNVTITPMTIPKVPKESSLPAISEIVKLTGDAQNGEVQAARCYACHKINGNGVAYGPDLRGWVAGQGIEQFLRAVIDPSAEIAHGFTGASVKLANDAGYIHGLAISRTDPVIIQSMGGITQILPKKKVEKVGKMKASLMLSADQLGLTAQDLADLAAFLKDLK